MWYLVCGVVGVVIGVVAMYFVAPKLAVIQAKVMAAVKAVQGEGGGA